MSRKIGALWLRETKEGKKYFSGILQDLGGDINIAIFRNDKKEKENHPDYNIVLSEKPKAKVAEDVEVIDAGADEINTKDIPF